MKAVLLVLPGMAAYLKSDDLKANHALGWVQPLADFAHFLTFSMFEFVGGLCALAQICVSWGLRSRARALYRQCSDLLFSTLGGTGGQIAVPIGLALLTIVWIARHGPPAGDGDRFIAVNSSGPAGNSITERIASEEVRGAPSVAKGATPASERKSSDGMEVAGGTPAVSSTTPVESRTSAYVNEPGDEMFNGIVSFGKEAGLGNVPDSGMLAGRPADSPPVHDIVTSPLEQGAQESKGTPGSSQNSGNISRGPHAGDPVVAVVDSLASAGSALSRSQPPVHKADQRPPAPSALRVALISP